MFQGSLVALVTPMQQDGGIDEVSLRKLIKWHLDQNTDGLVVTGTTGEASSLLDEEYYRVISLAVSEVAHQVPVIAGTGTHNTKHSIELTRYAKKAGADAALVITPYYNKPTQKGLYEHYRLIAEKVGLPLILYNVPSRTACDLLPETVEALSKFSNIIGIKEATGQMPRIAEIRKRCGKDFAIFSGDDLTALNAMNEGAVGVISVTANVAPNKMHRLCVEALSDEKALADSIQAELLPLHKALFLESNPIPAKWALHKMGLIPPGIRLPLTPLDNKFHSDVEKAMELVGVL